MMSGRSGWRWISRISVFTVLPSTASSMMVLSGSTPWSAFSSALASTSSDWVSRPWPEITAGTLPRKRAWRAPPLPVACRGLAAREMVWAMESVTRYTLQVARSVEQRAHRLIAVLIPDGLGYQSRDRQHLQSLEVALFGDPNRVRHDDLIDTRRAQPLHCRTRQQGVGRERVDLARAQPLQRRRRLGDRPRRVDHVVGDEAIFVGHVADYVDDLGHVRRGAPLVDDRQRRVQALRESTGHLGGP